MSAAAADAMFFGFSIAADLLSMQPPSSKGHRGGPPPTSLVVTPMAVTPLANSEPEGGSGSTPVAKTTPVAGDAFLRGLPYTVTQVVARAARAGYEVEVPVGGRPPAALFAWKARMAVEEWLAEPAAVEAAELPVSVEALTRRVWDGFVFLLACKRLWSTESSTTFGRNFAGPWCGVTPRQARDRIAALRRMGYMVDTGRRSHRAIVWTPRRKGAST